MTIVASNSLTISNVNDGTITHIAYANIVFLCKENGNFTLSATSIVRYGSDSRWIYKEFQAGTYTATNTLFGGGPASGTQKNVELVDNFSTSNSTSKTHIGMYADNVNLNSTDPSKYLWTLVKGADGKDGANGHDGIAGKDGKGIATTAITYQASTNGTTAPTGTWSTNVPTVDKGSFLWTRTIWTYTDNTTETGYAVAYMGTNGNNGTNGIAGKDGVGIKTTTITYAGSTSGTTAPTTGYTITVPSVPAGQFLWTKTIWTYTDNSTETGYSVAMMGLKGDKGDMGKSVWSYPYDRGNNRLGNWWSDLKPTPTTDNPPKFGDTLIDLVGKIYQITNVVVGTAQQGGGTFDYGPMLTSVKGTDGNPGKIVSNTEPTTKFNGLTWKYSGANDITASDGTNILAGTEYYWNGTVWALYEINAHNINGDNLSVTNGTFKDGKIESIWGSNGVNGTTTIENNHLLIHSTNSVPNTENTVSLDNEQGYAQVYVDKKTGRTITVQASVQGFFVSDSTGPYVSVTPTGIVNSVDVSWTTIGSYAAYRRDGRVVTIRVVGAKRSTTGDIYIGAIPLKDCPAASVMGNAIAWSAGVANDKHIQINGLNQSNSGAVTILAAVATQEYTFQFTYQI